MKNIFNGEKYKLYRPKYPEELIDYISNLSISKELAWDCCTGTGNVAKMLSTRFLKVIGSDISKDQIDHAIQGGNIDYKVENIYDASVPNGQIDLITVAQSFHWLDKIKFYNKSNEALKSGGILAIWCYTHGLDRKIADIIKKYLSVTSYFLNEEEIPDNFFKKIEYVERGYYPLEIPFKKLENKIFDMKHNLTLEQFIGYLESISIASIYIKKYGHSPIKYIKNDLLSIWKNDKNNIPVTWQIQLHLFRKIE